MNNFNQNNHKEKIRVRGAVQGVGFRPKVWQHAQALGICGEVINDGSGVLIIAQSNIDKINKLITLLQEDSPKLAQIESIERELIFSNKQYRQFKIEKSITTQANTNIVADAATCDDCLNDINNKTNRRYKYPFTNCTHCGPRLSIIKKIPYDRINTSMADFKQCHLCLKEYNDPVNRRFHAQPNACPECGPILSLYDSKAQLIDTDDAIKSVSKIIEKGGIVAIKGLGGFQFACDANNIDAIKLLRKRKHRPHKALALMANNIQKIEKYCHVSNDEKKRLLSPQSPILLLTQKNTLSDLTNEIAPKQNTLGFMLPNTPLHHLLLSQLKHPIVLTSGNLSNEPQSIDNKDAFLRLAHIADYFLTNNRDIINRIDDSVVRINHGRTHIYRRARGYAPNAIKLPKGFDTNLNILACGSEQKNTFCLIKNGKAIVSQHIGNLENNLSYEDYLHNLKLYKNLYQFKPEHIAVDIHPEYISSKYGRQLSTELSIPLFQIQHHHAHIAACMADNEIAINNSPVIGVAMDGLGYGDDGTIWGGEFLIADYQGFQRKARLKPTPMPGGMQAILEPWRNTLAQLSTHNHWENLTQEFSSLDLVQYLLEKPYAPLNKMMKSQINSPISSSCGRLFDSVSAALAICNNKISYQGQAAIELESFVLENNINYDDIEQSKPYPFSFEKKQLSTNKTHSVSPDDLGSNQHKLIEINPAPLWISLLNDLKKQVSTSLIATRFHTGLAKSISETVKQISDDSGITTVVLSGGVFQNKTLFNCCVTLLEKKQINVLFHQQVPCNDGGLSLGQAVIAAAKVINRE